MCRIAVFCYVKSVSFKDMTNKRSDFDLKNNKKCYNLLKHVIIIGVIKKIVVVHGLLRNIKMTFHFL